MSQLEKWLNLASAVAAAVNPGTLPHIVANSVVIGLSAFDILSPLKPGSMVEALNRTIEETSIHYDKHKDKLDESTASAFNEKIKRLKNEALKLNEWNLEAHEDDSLTDLGSWRSYMKETKDAWVKARQHQREAIKLGRELKLAVVRADGDELEAELGHHGQEGGESTGGGGGELGGSTAV
ncbi:hypothetical protein ARMGADRAFT_1083158 [Armillaria gallica]|uniref:Uncharacterized protein n=1 Tax=Armillaria gallica TaxID=47427 RepID=A0A2H3D4X9_ARMGA|nr:hypothetical protein ARMGADRAFT_1083158 [Armillaria gallica]